MKKKYAQRSQGSERTERNSVRCAHIAERAARSVLHTGELRCKVQHSAIQASSTTSGTLCHDMDRGERNRTHAHSAPQQNWIESGCEKSVTRISWSQGAFYKLTYNMQESLSIEKSLFESTTDRQSYAFIVGQTNVWYQQQTRES